MRRGKVEWGWISPEGVEPHFFSPRLQEVGTRGGLQWPGDPGDSSRHPGHFSVDLTDMWGSGWSQLSFTVWERG